MFMGMKIFQAKQINLAKILWVFFPPNNSSKDSESVKSLSPVWLFETPWGPLSMGFSR